MEIRTDEAKLLPHLNESVVKGITGFSLDAYLVALEGWRRGLELKWYKEQSDLCKINVLPGKTNGRFFSLSFKDKTHFFLCSRGDKGSNESASICRNKSLTKEKLKEAGVSVPEGATLDDDDEIISYAEKIGYPVVLKPLKGSMGKGVYVNIKTKDELLTALKELRKTEKDKRLIIEKYYPGNEYRVYVVGDKVVSAVNRIPANVIGDGVHTIKELIEIKNKERGKNPYLATKPIKVDSEVRKLLESKGYTIDSIPRNNEQVFLREKSNLSQGGDPIEAIHELSDEVKQIAINALKALPSMGHAGLDMIINPKNNREATVIEINSKAEIAFHLFPIAGEAKDVPGAIIDYYFPESTNNKKTLAYFDYQSILEPLSTWAVEELSIAKPPCQPIYKKTYRVKGKVQRVGYMSYIKRQALRCNLHGRCKKLKNDVEVTIIGSDPTKLDDFKKIICKGSRKSKVKEVIDSKTELLNEPFKIGFEIFSD